MAGGGRRLRFRVGCVARLDAVRGVGLLLLAAARAAQLLGEDASLPVAPVAPATAERAAEHAGGHALDVVLAGDAAGVVAPSSGEGIYYAMVGGRVAATAAAATLATGKAKNLMLARKLFMREHKTVFRVLASMQNA